VKKTSIRYKDHSVSIPNRASKVPYLPLERQLNLINFGLWSLPSDLVKKVDMALL
jgi:hypothetical protein